MNSGTELKIQINHAFLTENVHQNEGFKRARGKPKVEEFLKNREKQGNL